jgi:hypothetical protein
LAPPFFANPPRSYPAAAPVAHVSTRAQTAGVALLVAAAVLLVAALTKSWFTADNGGVGLVGLESCRGDVCRSITWFDVRRVPAQLPIFATTALITTLALAAFTAHSGIALIRRRPRTVKLVWLSQMIGLASFGLAAFLFSLSIGDWSRGLSFGWSALAGVVAVAATGLIAGFLVRPLTRR